MNQAVPLHTSAAGSLIAGFLLVSKGVDVSPTKMLQGSSSTNTKTVSDSMLITTATPVDIAAVSSHLKETAAVCSEPLVLHQIISNQSTLPVVAATDMVNQVLQGQNIIVALKSSQRLPGVSDDLL